MPSGIYGIRFSRDGRRIAVVTGRSWSDESILILDAHEPDSHWTKVDANPQFWKWEPSANIRFEWSPSGQHILFGKKIVQVADGKTCTLPYPGIFVGADQIISYQPKPGRFSIYDLECRVVRVWQEFPDEDRVDNYVASAERGILAVTQDKVAKLQIVETRQSVVDIESHAAEARSRIPVLGDPQFADAGSALCGSVYEAGHRTIECLEANDGRVVGVSKGWDYPGVRPALASSRVVISDYTKSLDWIDLFWHPGSVRTRAIWDFHSGKEIARWKPKTQKVFTGEFP